VATIDGVVAIPGVERSNALIAGGDPADRFVMGLLRTAADAVLVGCGTVNASPTGRWRADTVFPAAADAFRELRAEPARVAIATGRGGLNPEHPVLREGALVIATQLAADRLADRLPEEAELAVVPGESAVEVDAAVALLRERGYRRILSEAGPRLFGSLVAAELVDHLFLTVSPLLAGRATEEERLGIVEGIALLPEHERRGSLRSARVHREHLFLRYAF
jgi:riboflavin biosynthesis pyrimidine reductase